MQITIPANSLIVLVGASGAGKSTFARGHFLPTEVVSSDQCRALVSDDPNDQTASRDAFDVLHLIAARRLARGRLTVIDATNVQSEHRKELVNLAQRHQAHAVAIVFALPAALCVARDAARIARTVGSDVIHAQLTSLAASPQDFAQEGFHLVYCFKSAEEVAAAIITRS